MVALSPTPAPQSPWEIRTPTAVTRARRSPARRRERGLAEGTGPCVPPPPSGPGPEQSGLPGKGRAGGGGVMGRTTDSRLLVCYKIRCLTNGVTCTATKHPLKTPTIPNALLL